jgi:hypothetical protein
LSPSSTAYRRDSLPALFCFAVGAVLVAAGIIGFFYNGTFTSDPGVHDDVLGLLSVNGWHNVVHLATGSLLLIGARSAPRLAAGLFGVVYVAVAIWGVAIGDGHSILSIVPINTADNVLHALLGLTGLTVYAAGAGTSGAPAAPARA